MKHKLLEMLGLDKIMGSLHALVETRVAMIKEEIEEKVVSSIVKTLPYFLIILALVFFVFFASITLGLYLSIVTGNTVLGFGIVTGFYFLVGLVFFLLRKSKFFNEGFEKHLREKHLKKKQ